MIVSNASGISEFMLEGLGGGVNWCAWASSIAELLEKGNVPVRISKKTIPSE
jgi:hypothetical protein